MKNAGGKLIVFSAPSGSGKTTLVKHLLAQKLGLSFSISATSREKRGAEVEGKDYYFLTPGNFEQKINNGEFLEWEEVYKDNFYGTLISEVERIWANGEAAIFDIDVVGGLNIKSKYPKETLAIFVKPPSKEVMEKRLRGRQTDSEEKIRERIAKADKEMKYAEQFDVVLINDNLEKAKIEAENLVKNFLNKD